jgi:hypothetical protein
MLIVTFFGVELRRMTQALPTTEDPPACIANTKDFNPAAASPRASPPLAQLLRTRVHVGFEAYIMI